MDMKKMMKQAQKMQRDAAAAQQEIAAMTFEASAGGGMVKATATGEMAITDITIDSAAVDPEDVEMLQDMVVAAVNEALRAASEAANARMNAVMGGMKIPGLM
ncbi:YbaB/EbfC family nucleoid-associated protein [Adlercreutzia equolifaciens]|uniref:YbaB/EbfC family nucleoid-associated protein n=1 Tax=Adlercreutzia equolifaciens TaxID=446660 RepID=UPI003AEF1EFF